MAEIETAIRRESANTVSWGSIFRSRGNLRRLRIIIGIACECLLQYALSRQVVDADAEHPPLHSVFSQWSGNGLVSYYLTDILNSVGITSQTTQTLYNGILQVRSPIWVRPHRQAR
jgi:hypothetical protein